MKHLYHVLVFLLLSAISSTAQNVNYFTERPADLTIHYNGSLDMMKEIMQSRFSDMIRSDGLLINDVTRSGAMFTRTLHSSGKVIFNCPATAYLQELKSKLLNDYPKVEKMINVYVTEDPSLNAFATVTNNIYVNVGLLAKVENEAQLAYILCHEIMHIVNAHIVHQTLAVSEKVSSYGKKDLMLEDELVNLYRHSISREHENEADADGLTLYLKQDYGRNEALNALLVLERSSILPADLPLNKDVWFADSITFKTILNKREVDGKPSRQRFAENLTTHPLIEDRVSNIEERLSEFESTHGNVQYLVSEDSFKEIRSQANSMVALIYANNFDFIALFQITAYKYHIEGDRSAQNINRLNFALQGILIDNLQKVDYSGGIRVNETETVLYDFLNNAPDKDIARWVYRAMKQIKTDNPTVFDDHYLEATHHNICDGYSGRMHYVVGDDSCSHTSNIVVAASGLKFEAIDFTVSSSVDLLRKDILEFEESKGAIGDSGKIAILGMNNIKVAINHETRQFEADPIEIEKLVFRTDKVWRNLEEDYDGKIVSVIPNNMHYTGAEYNCHNALNQWLENTLYFGSHEYVRLNQNEFDSLVIDKGIRYAFVSLNVAVKSFSYAKFIKMWFSIILMPHYLPQRLVDVLTGSTRTYQLSLIFDTKTGQLVYYDKRTYVEPSSVGHLYMEYNDVFTNFLNR
jgi:hypothetical protein